MTETPIITDHPAAGFDVEGWLQDAHMPEESADVYKRADVIGELSALRRKIEVAREASAGAEKTADNVDQVTPLEAKYEELLETFSGSQLTIYVRALGPEEKQALRAAHEEACKDMPPLEKNERYGYDLMAAAITAVRPFEGERQDVTWSPEQVKKIVNTIGSMQMQLLLDAYQTAQSAVPSVDADFLRKPSGEETGPE